MSRSRPKSAAVVLAAALLVLTGCTDTQPGDVAATASVEQPQALSDAQTESLATMRFKNYTDGVLAFEGQLLGGESGDMALAGWLDFTHRTGYARVVPSGAAPILVVWDESDLAFLDIVDAKRDASTEALAAPPTEPPAGDWQRTRLVADTSDLTRMLTALLLLSADRPENPLLLAQNGARFLGTEEVAGAQADRFSGVAADGAAAEEADLGSQYWLDADGRLVRFGLRVAGNDLSTVDLLRGAETPDALPGVDVVGTPAAG